AQVDDVAAALTSLYRARRQAVHDADAVVTRRDQSCARRGAERDGRPAGGLEFGGHPGAPFRTQVRAFAHLHLVHPRAAVRAAAVSNRSDRYRFTRRKTHLQLTQHGRHVAVALTTPGTNAAGVPAVAQANRQHVVARSEQRANIARLVLDAHVVVGPAW